MTTATVTCETEGCPKAGEAVPGVPITHEDPEGNETRVDTVTCGVCGQEITKIEEEA